MLFLFHNEEFCFENSFRQIDINVCAQQQQFYRQFMDNLPDIQALYQLKYLKNNRGQVDKSLGNIVEKAKHLHRKIISNLDEIKHPRYAKIIHQKPLQSIQTQPFLIIRQKTPSTSYYHSYQKKKMSQANNNHPIKNEYLRKFFKLSMPQMVELQHKMGGQKNLTYLLNNFYERKHKMKQVNRLSNGQEFKMQNKKQNSRYKLANPQKKLRRVDKSLNNEQNKKDDQCSQEKLQTSKSFFKTNNEFRCSIQKNNHNSWHTRHIENNPLKHIFNESSRLQRANSYHSNMSNMKRDYAMNSTNLGSIKDRQLTPWSVIDLQTSS